MTSNQTWQQAFEYNFRFQNGMYLDGQKQVDGASIFFSNYIDDVYWNYAVFNKPLARSSAWGIGGIFGSKGDDKLDTTTITTVEGAMRGMQRKPAFYLTPWTDPRDLVLNELRSRGCERQYQDAWMFFEGTPTQSEALSSDLAIQVASNATQQDDFVGVFMKAYSGELSESEPYGGLKPTYFDALRQSFGSRDVETLHLIGYQETRPVAIATLVYAEGWGGIYNVGTDPEYRQRGLGSAISQACINMWKQRSGRALFLQTESGSAVEAFYRKLGFSTQFVGECWAA